MMLGERKDRSAGNDEEVPQLREPGDDVMGQAIRNATADAGGPLHLDEWHHDDRGTLRRSLCGVNGSI